MSLDGALEVAVYVRNFHNLDLFQQGWYGLKVTCFWETEDLPLRKGIPSRVVQYAVPDVKHGEASTFWQINDIDSSYNSRPFRVRYSRQDVVLQEMVSFKLAVTQEKPMDHGVIIRFDLLFAALDREQALSSPPDVMNSVANHSFRIVGGAWTGLHTFCPITFDSWHFVYVEANIHSVLLSFSETLLLPRSSPREDRGLTSSTKATADLESERQKKIGEGGRESQGPGLHSSATNTENPNASLPPRKPNMNDLKLLRLLVASREKLYSELQVLSSFSDEPAFKIPVFSRSPVSRKLEKSEEASSDYGPVVTGGIANGDEEAGKGEKGSIGKGQNLSENDNRSEEFVKPEEKDALLISAEEWIAERGELTAQLSTLWNIFLNLHRLQQARICGVLRERWEGGRFKEAAQFVVGLDLCMEDHDIFGMSPTDWLTHSGSSKATLAQKQQEEKVLVSANKAQLYRSVLSHTKSKYFPFQDTQYFGNTASQAIVFGERHEPSLKGRSPVSQTEGLTRSQIDGLQGGGRGGGGVGEGGGVGAMLKGFSLTKSMPRKREAKHVVVFVHGFQGHHMDLRLIRNHWMIMDPEIECVMSDINEERTFDSFAQMGQRLAEEVSSFLSSTFNAKAPPSRRNCLQKLSFVGHSIGNLIIRSAVADAAMKPYLQYLHTFLSISGPHLGYLYSSNNIFNGGLWLLKRFKNMQVMHELTFTDHPEIRDCYLYQLSQMGTFEHFQHLILLSSPQDRYVPHHSARIEMCPAAMRDVKRGACYAAMVHGCLSPLLKRGASEKRTFLRCDVNFDVSAQAGTVNGLIGRTAHIEFLETDVYIRFILWYYRDCFV